MKGGKDKQETKGKDDLSHWYRSVPEMQRLLSEEEKSIKVCQGK